MPDKLTVSEAASRLGISQDAVYKRIERNKIRHERDASGRVYVWVDISDMMSDRSTGHESEALTAQMQARIDSL
jgi:excisionase family DNA binding protein